MTRLTAIVLVKNEEESVINRCLKSVEFCDEIIIVNDILTQNSKVKSPHFAQGLRGARQKYNSKVKSYFRELGKDFASQRNFGMEKATGEWILFVDTDEEVTEELKNVILNLIQDLNQIPKRVRNDTIAYYIKRRDFFWGHEMKYGETSKARNKGIIRLMKKNSGKWMGQVHEEFKISGQIGYLNGYLNHYPHQTVKEFIQSVNFYSSLRAEELYKQGKKTNIFEIIFYPLFKFKLTYFIKLGFLDGPAGFAYSFFMSFHSLLVRLKLYQKLYLNNG